ncbi:lipopolysaccharide biosynthesis protein [Sphingomonas cavernae]|uniref:lipopolysaccharide biosynthesis protein n=1 Tax=Sphingomonas cavernae TaxID=2320861 RepID=UPI0016009FDF|nr:oligosaccharide flippase family protein [Sphingomonas cavernae]
MIWKRPVFLSTVSLVAVRFLGVGARYFGLLTLASIVPAAQFASYALAFIVAEFARCLADGGVDTVYLRRAEALEPDERVRVARRAMLLKLMHGLMTAVGVIIILNSLHGVNLLMLFIGLQFFPQSLLQLTLNVRQVDNKAHEIVGIIGAVYVTAMAMAVLSHFGFPTGKWCLPYIAVAELICAAIFFRVRLIFRINDLRVAYKVFFPQALPVLGLALLAYANTRTDALLVSKLMSPDVAGKYMYLARWVDFVPMLIGGVALPLVGKIPSIRAKGYWYFGALFAVATAWIPFAIAQLVVWFNPAYAPADGLQWILATIAGVRAMLTVTTVLLLSVWRDGWLFRIAICTSITIPLVGWQLGSAFGAVGVAGTVLAVEASNLLCQIWLLLRLRDARQN